MFHRETAGNHYLNQKKSAFSGTSNVSSKPQQAVFNIGDEKKFEVNNDSYYDLIIRLNSIKRAAWV